MSAMTDDKVYGSSGLAGLQVALSFTDADLAENRLGRMSASQAARMAKGQSQSRVASVVMLVIFVALIIVIAIVVLPPSLAPQPATSSAVPPWIIGVVILVVAGVIMLSFLRARRGFRGLTGALLHVDGVANPKSSTFGDANQEGFDTIHRVHIGGMNFPLASDLQVRAFDKGRRYRAYYVKSTLPVILSAEPLDS
jgi:uncharacterized membrane protein (DUF485 family)